MNAGEGGGRGGDGGDGGCDGDSGRGGALQKSRGHILARLHHHYRDDGRLPQIGSHDGVNRLKQGRDGHGQTGSWCKAEAALTYVVSGIDLSHHTRQIDEEHVRTDVAATSSRSL